LRKETDMVAKKKATTGKGQVKKLKLKRETLKDLDAKGKAKDVKGGNTGTTFRIERRGFHQRGG
jgi:hypothetical protein